MRLRLPGNLSLSRHAAHGAARLSRSDLSPSWTGATSVHGMSRACHVTCHWADLEKRPVTIDLSRCHGPRPPRATMPRSGVCKTGSERLVPLWAPDFVHRLSNYGLSTISYWPTPKHPRWDEPGRLGTGA